EPTRREIDPAHGADVENGQRVVEVFQMKRFDELQTVERDVHLIDLRSAHVEPGREVVRRETRQPIDGPEQIVAELRARANLVAVERLRRADLLRHDPEVAGRYDNRG